MISKILQKIEENSKEQNQLLKVLIEKQKPESKLLKVLGAAGPLISGILIAIVGWYFTSTNNKQQLKLAEIGVIEKFAPKMQDSVIENRLAALSAILSLDDEDLAIRTVSILGIADRGVILSRLFNAAVYTQDYSLMTRILRLYHGTISPDDFNRQPLIIAIDNKDIKTVKFLIKHEFDINGMVSGGEMPLNEACIIGESEIVQLLLDKGANPNILDTKGNSPLMNAVELGKLETVRVLLRNGKVDPEIRNEKKENALLIALKPRLFSESYPSGEIVRLLLDANADVNVVSEVGSSPLIESINSNYFESFKLLFAHSLKNKEYGDINMALLQAVEMGRDKIVKFLFDNGIPAKFKTEDGKTLLHFVKNNPLVAELLLDAHVDVNEKDKNGKSALHSLLENVMYLGVSAEERAEYNRDLNDGILKVLKLFVKAGANVNEYSENNNLPLSIAAIDRNVPIVEFLLKSGAKIDSASGSDRETALMNAAFFGRSANVRALLRYGANKQVKNAKEETALQIATDNLNFYQQKLAEGNHEDSNMVEKLKTTVKLLSE